MDLGHVIVTMTTTACHYQCTTIDEHKAMSPTASKKTKCPS